MRIAYRRYHDIGPKAGSVLAKAPVLFLEASRFRSDAQAGRGRSRGDRFRRVEAGEVLADDLLRLIPLDLLGTVIPARHATAGVEHENGVIAYAAHEEAEPLFAQSQRLLGGDPLRVGAVQ